MKYRAMSQPENSRNAASMAFAAALDALLLKTAREIGVDAVIFQ